MCCWRSRPRGVDGDQPPPAAHGFHAASAGLGALRTDTACIALLSLVHAAMGDTGNGTSVLRGTKKSLRGRLTTKPRGPATRPSNCYGDNPPGPPSGVSQPSRNPLFATIAILSPALGIGANAAIFTLIDQIAPAAASGFGARSAGDALSRGAPQRQQHGLPDALLSALSGPAAARRAAGRSDLPAARARLDQHREPHRTARGGAASGQSLLDAWGQAGARTGLHAGRRRPGLSAAIPSSPLATATGSAASRATPGSSGGKISSTTSR